MDLTVYFTLLMTVQGPSQGSLPVLVTAKIELNYFISLYVMTLPTFHNKSRTFKYKRFNGLETASNVIL